MDIIAMEVTKEEMEKILRDRVESARTAEINECGEVIKRAGPHPCFGRRSLYL